MSKKPDTKGTISQDNIMAEVMEFIKSKSIYQELQEEIKKVSAWHRQLESLEQNLKDAKNELNQIKTQTVTIKQQLDDKTLPLENIQEICNTENQLAIKHRALSIHIKNLDNKISEHQQQYHSDVMPLTKELYGMVHHYLWEKIEEVAQPYINVAILCKKRAHSHLLDSEDCNIQLWIQDSENYKELTTQLDNILPVGVTWYPIAGLRR